MKFSEWLLEAPLPDDWDSAMFNQRIPFAKRVRYAKERAQQIGKGSSRVAFKIPYQGRPTVLKVALNKKGEAQNEQEAIMLNDYYLKSIGVVIPMIDYDESGSRPTWIHTEFASKGKISDIKKATRGNGAPGGDLYDLFAAINQQLGKSSKGVYMGSPDKIDMEGEFFNAMLEFVGSYSNIPTGDFIRIANWGSYKGSPVIIDMGLSDDIMKTYYS